LGGGGVPSRAVVGGGLGGQGRPGQQDQGREGDTKAEYAKTLSAFSGGIVCFSHYSTLHKFCADGANNCMENIPGLREGVMRKT
jgi:hypothetical protein